jgi:translation initiation factor 3 subunit B
MAPIPAQHVVNGNPPFSLTEDGELDFSDLEKKYAVSYEEGFDNFIVVDNCPIVADEARKQKLIAFLRRIFSTSGMIKEDGIYMPMGKNPETGKVESRGYVFIEYDTPEQAAAAIKTKDGHSLDKSHRLSVNKFTDIEKYCTHSDHYVEPEIEPYIAKVKSPLEMGNLIGLGTSTKLVER